MSVETSNVREITFQELPIGSKFRGPDGGMYWKVNDTQILPIRESTQGGTIGWGRVLEWKPEWNATMKFQNLPESEVPKFKKANTVDLHEGQPIRVFMEDLCDVLREGRDALVAGARKLLQRS